MTETASFDGETFCIERDEIRLTGQLAAVYAVMSMGRWHTLADLARAAGGITGRRYSEAGVSARIRDLRKPRFGGHRIDAEHVRDGLWRYRMVRD